MPNESQFEKYLQDIRFRSIQPDTALNTKLSQSVFQWLKGKIGNHLEWKNTLLPPTEYTLKTELKHLSTMPKASTLALGAIINRAVSRLNEDECFLNIGVWHGYTFLAGLLHNGDKNCIGVDNFCVNQKIDSNGKPVYKGLSKWFYKRVDNWARSSFMKRFEKIKSKDHKFYKMDYVQYLKNVHKEKIGFYIYDAQHRYKDQRLALELAEPFFSDNCIVFIDDTNDEDNRQATLDFIKDSPHEYRMIMDIQTDSNRHPTFWNGFMVFQKVHSIEKGLSLSHHQGEKAWLGQR